MKYYLLIAGHNYYPSIGTEDWIGCYETYDEAQNVINVTEIPKEWLKFAYKIDNKIYDWYKIVDLREWIK